MKIRTATVGPLLGHTTDTATRIWLRGDFQQTESGPRRAFAAYQIRKKGAKSFGDAQFVPLMPHFDMTGVSVFTGLKGATDYEYRAGWFFADTELDNLDANQTLDWSEIEVLSLTTGTAVATAPRTYVAGSCRYLLRLFGGSVWDERGDKAFRSILEQSEKKGPIHGVILMGDQIYAPDLRV
jgi:alkaline phosphatase D